MPRAWLQALLSPEAAGNRAGAQLEPMPMSGVPPQESWGAPGCSTPWALPALPTKPGGSSTLSNLS